MKAVRMWGIYGPNGNLHLLANTEREAKEQYRDKATHGLPIAKPAFNFYEKTCGVRCVRVTVTPDEEGE